MMTKQPGVMAPPTLYEQPATRDLMSPTAAAPHTVIRLRALLWWTVALLTAIELGPQRLP
jgi:hypothetical protein